MKFNVRSLLAKLGYVWVFGTIAAWAAQFVDILPNIGHLLGLSYLAGIL